MECKANVRITWRLPRCIYDIYVCLCARRFTNNNEEKMSTSPVVLSTWQSNRKRNENTRARFIRNRSETVVFAVIISFIHSCSCTASDSSLFKRRRESALLVSTLRRRRRQRRSSSEALQNRAIFSLKRKPKREVFSRSDFLNGIFSSNR